MENECKPNQVHMVWRRFVVALNPFVVEADSDEEIEESSSANSATDHEVVLALRSV